MDSLFDPTLPEEMFPRPTIDSLPPLVRLTHYTFEQWFIIQFRQGLLPRERFDIMDMQVEWMKLCWIEEYKFNQWKESVSHGKRFQVNKG